MKMKMKIVKPMLSAVCLAAALMAPGSVKAVTLSLFDANELGFVNFGIPSGDADRTTYVNHLIGMNLSTANSGDGQNYTRSANDFGPLDPAVFDHNGTDTSVDTGANGFQYLFAKYDGPNYGSEVWYVGGLTGIITIPATAGGYGLSGWTLFTPTDDTDNTPVPDGGSTMALLGFALVGVDQLRRKMIKA